MILETLVICALVGLLLWTLLHIANYRRVKKYLIAQGHEILKCELALTGFLIPQSQCFTVHYRNHDGEVHEATVICHSWLGGVSIRDDKIIRYS